jgi:hypothetical protein
MRFGHGIRRARQATPLAVALALTPMLAAAATSAPARTARPTAAAAHTAPTPVRHTLPFVSDDYSRALAEAKARQVPIFVESWAPW